jgi:hypothetical protein
MKKINLLIAVLGTLFIMSCSSNSAKQNSSNGNENATSKSDESTEPSNAADLEIKNFLSGKTFKVVEGQSMAPFNSLSFSAEGMCTYGKTTENFDIKDNVLLIGTGGLTLKYDFVKVDDSSFKIKVGQEKKEFVYTLSK